MNAIPNNSLHEHDVMMDSLQKHHDILLPLLRSQSIHYLDIPFHGNIGDLLIMLGTLTFFDKNDLSVICKGMYFNYSSSLVKPGDVIVFHGGGNFGDIYGPFQAFREKIISTCPDNRIVILPQTLHFADPEKFKKCCHILSKHSDLHICVRDKHSEKMAQEMTQNVYLLPDMAHQLWPITRTVSPTKKRLKLHRRDNEALSAQMGSEDSFDWEDLIGWKWKFFLSQIAERSMYHANRFGINKPFINQEANLWIKQAQRFVDQAVLLFSDYDQIESDRLHAHILSCLLSMPNCISDNSYGKNERYISTWTKKSPLVTLL